MKHILDYIQEECEGCATLANTMGMGNPMAPTETEPGTEPISIPGPKKEKKNTSKRKKKVNEGILDIDSNIENLDKNIILAWLKKVAGDSQVEKEISINDNLEISIKSALIIGLEEPIPEYIHIKDIKGRGLLKIETDRSMEDLVIPENFLPKNFSKLKIYHYGKGSLIFKSKTLELDKFSANGDITNIEFPTRFKCDDMNISGCDKISDIKNINLVKKVNFPISVGVNLIRKYMKFGGEIQMNGFGPY